MCLITKNEKQIATEDITCYKILSIDNWSTTFSYHYKFLEKYETEIKEDDDWLVVDRLATSSLEEELKEYTEFHYNPYYTFNEIKGILHALGFRCYGQGFHSFASLDRALLSFNTIYKTPTNQKFVKCVIPKGSEYILDNNECLISNQIIVIGDII